MFQCNQKSKTKTAFKFKTRHQTLHTAEGRVIARVQTDDQGRLYSTKRISVERHQLRTPPAFAMDVSALNEAQKLGVKYHQLQDRETGQYFVAWHHDFIKHGFPVNRGFNPQTALGLAWWQKRPQPSDYGPQPKPPAAALQQDLFGDGMGVAA
ncbi:MAG: hypothetical protein KF784_08665 [Fimbriimonadaceae bacterium]|nr:hypothetical protein [Fimbriimonadaceae bacterium]